MITALGRAWILCAVLDILAAFALSWVQAGRGPGQVLKGVAAALAGPRALDGGAGMAALGLAMHAGVALAWSLVGLWLVRRIAMLRTAPLWVAGPAYGASVFCAMKFAVLPATWWVRSLYLETAVTWPAALGWPVFLIHLAFVGTPIIWAVRRTR